MHRVSRPSAWQHCINVVKLTVPDLGGGHEAGLDDGG